MGIRDNISTIKTRHFSLALIWVLFMSVSLSGQQCPTTVLTSPLNGATNVPVDADISWNQVPNVPGYIISLGTTEGGTDILDERFVGSTTTYNPPLGLPENTTIYVTITLFDFQNGNIEVPCESESFTTAAITQAPACTSLLIPTNGQANVNPATNIRWSYVAGAIGYRLTLGTSPGGGEILPSTDLGNTLSYTPPVEFLPNTTIYVRITPYNLIGAGTSCTDFSFSTSEVAALPGCTSLISPVNGATNVPVTPILEWTPVPGATGYRITVGISPFTAEILDNVAFPPITQTGILELEANRTFFITIVPFNAAGEAIGCVQETFTTLQGCGPFFDPSTGNLITLNPVIDFPEVISTCNSEFPLAYTAPDMADGYRWYRINSNGNETLISDVATVSFQAPGSYRYEAYTLIPQSGNLECPTSQIFEVVSSEAPVITSINVTEQANGIRIAVNASGSGEYEYAIDNLNGPYQSSNVFVNIPYGTHTLYVRDRNGCGVASEQIVQDLTLEGFPKFFSPNGDGINDYWQYIPPEFVGDITLVRIEIYNRYGQFLVQIDPDSRGWDGTINGSLLPAADYWYRAISSTNKQLTGHFALTR
ncbi:gliding motility-associated C-terminal domain-containing protein [Muriicola jejuensis]|uniref:T9SS type B sorting domain-containing protein n=1 Tax=Muriicola jejuensis TaxID=504488 RepID=A0A6P0UBS7_9FLAO|nr:T9SS type B sorting domain-containing protein [Muriicola jejuensis]NER10741.1 T9SS type B sorting domain-containing protein [Muriicola jejuensis]SMP16519.1 gliding motility-associated C-terminal domain-containing protein [Muriicola jejuensis]